VRQVNARLWTIDDLDLAESHIRRALELSPHHPRALTTRALILRLRGRDDDALAIYREILAHHPGSAVAHYNIAIMLLGRTPAEALAHFAAGAALDPEDADYPVGEARALVALGRRSEARRALARAKELAPDHPRIAELTRALDDDLISD
jgi:Flp pilus assembly protein TadD